MAYQAVMPHVGSPEALFLEMVAPVIEDVNGGVGTGSAQAAGRGWPMAGRGQGALQAQDVFLGSWRALNNALQAGCNAYRGAAVAP